MIQDGSGTSKDYTYDTATTGNGGVITRIVYPMISNASAIIKAFARPSFVDKGLMKNAAAINPMALHMKIVATVP